MPPAQRHGSRLRRGRLFIFLTAFVCVLAVPLLIFVVVQNKGPRDSFAPAVGALFGGAVNLDSAGGDEESGNPHDVLLRENQLCRKYDNLNYYLFGLMVSDTQLVNPRWAIEQNKTPVVTLSWPQRMPDNPDFIPQVAAGLYDRQISITATKIKSLGGQIILRPYWEFNHADTGLSAANYDGDYSQFITAWQRTYAIFIGNSAVWKSLNIKGDAVEASNVRFSWNPGGARPNNVVAGVTEDYRPYYPGDAFVDWIGIDSYTDNRLVLFADIFAPPIQVVDWYASYAAKGKPMAIGETGIRPQSTYANKSPTRSVWYENALPAIKAMPMIKMFSYFDVSNEKYALPKSYQVDAPGGSTDDSSGLAFAAYAALANDRYFRRDSVDVDCVPNA